MAEEYNFSKFISVGSRLGNYFISLNKSGFIISSGLYVKEGIKNFLKVVLYFDNSRKAIGMEFTTNINDEGFTIIHNNSKTSGSVSARSFIIANSLNDPKYYGRCKPKKINYQGKNIFVIDLISKDKLIEKMTKKI